MGVKQLPILCCKIWNLSVVNKSEAKTFHKCSRIKFRRSHGQKENGNLVKNIGMHINCDISCCYSISEVSVDYILPFRCHWLKY